MFRSLELSLMFNFFCRTLLKKLVLTRRCRNCYLKCDRSILKTYCHFQWSINMIQLILSLSHLTWRMRKPWPNSTFLFNAYRMCFHLLSLELALANFKVMKILVRVLQHALAKLNPVRHDSLIIKWSFSIHVHWLGPQSIAAIFSTVIHGTSTAVFCLFKHFFSGLISRPTESEKHCHTCRSALCLETGANILTYILSTYLYIPGQNIRTQKVFKSTERLVTAYSSLPYEWRNHR